MGSKMIDYIVWAILHALIVAQDYYNHGNEIAQQCMAWHLGLTGD